MISKNNLTKKFKKGDLVMVMVGKDKGRTGNIIFINREEEFVKVSGLKMLVLHNKGEMSTKEGKIHLSNIALVDPKTNKPGRVGLKMDGDKKVRYFKNSGQVL